MNSFAGLVVGAIVIGGALVGAFLGGMTIGKGDTTEAATISFPTPTASSARGAQDAVAGGVGGGEVDLARLVALRQKFQSGEITEAEAEEFRTLVGRAASRGGGAGPFGRQFGGGAGGGGGLGGGGLRGAITEIAGNKITIETSQGPLTATLGSDTTILLFVDGEISDLTTGSTVTVGGERGEDGSIKATTVTVLPEGALGGGGFGGGGGRGGQAP